MGRAFIGIGSNVGDRRGQVRAALEALEARELVSVSVVSPLFETEPVGGPPGQGSFVNAAAELQTELEPLELLDVLLDVEHELGRRRTGHWQSRVIDLDLLLYDERVVAHPRLNVPHLRFRERRFVLEPLASIAAEAVDPVSGLTVQQLLDRLR